MWSAPVTITEPVSEPVTLAEAKEFVRVLANDFDVQLGGFITAARQQIEFETGTRLLPQVVELQADNWSDLALLSIGPVSEIVSIKYSDGDGAEQTLDPSGYELAGAGLWKAIRPAINATWPAARPVQGAIRVQMNVGYDPLPKPVWLAVQLMVGDLFAFRETLVTGTIATKLPLSMSVENCLVNHRIWL